MTTIIMMLMMVIAILSREEIITSNIIIIILSSKVNIITLSRKLIAITDQRNPTIIRHSARTGAITINVLAKSSWEGALTSVIGIERTKVVDTVAKIKIELLKQRLIWNEY